MTPRPQPVRRRAFTLLEVLMAIAILVILVGILVGGAFASYRWAKQRRTIAVLSTLDAVVNEYRETTGKDLPDTVFSISTFLSETYGSAGDGSGGAGNCAELIKGLDASLIRPSPGAAPTDVVDAWGASIIVYNTNRGLWLDPINPPPPYTPPLAPYQVNDSVYYPSIGGKRYRCIVTNSDTTPPPTAKWVEDPSGGRTYFWSCGPNGINESSANALGGDDIGSNGTNQ